MSIKRQTVWSLLPQLVAVAIGFFTMPLFLRYLGNDMYALWGYIVAFGGMFGFADFGLGVAVGRYVGVALGKNDHAAVRGYWGTGNVIILPFLALVTLGFIGVGVWLGPKWFNVQPEHVGMLRNCFIAGGFGIFSGYYAQYWLILSQAHLDFKFISVLRVGMTLAQILPSIALACYTQNPFLLVLWSVFINLLQLAIFIGHAHRHYHLGFNFRAASLARAREMAVYTSKMFLSLIAGSFFGNIDRVILGKLAPSADFSPYFFSGNLAARVQSLSVSVMAPVFCNTSRVVDSGIEVAAKIYNDTFAFVFEWYLFIALWVSLWHPILLQVWLTHSMGQKLGQETAGHIGPLLVPLLGAACLGAIANVSGSLLSSLNRVGSTMLFSTAAGLLALTGVWLGWQTAGSVGAAYGFLLSRLALVAQDLFCSRLLRAGGWLAGQTWRQFGVQGGAAAFFALAYFTCQRHSFWLLIPAGLHGVLMTAWLLRQQLRKHFATK